MPEPVKDLYLSRVLEESPDLDEAMLEERAEYEWLARGQQTSGTARINIHWITGNWRSEAPDPCQQWAN